MFLCVMGVFGGILRCSEFVFGLFSVLSVSVSLGVCVGSFEVYLIVCR